MLQHNNYYIEAVVNCAVLKLYQDILMFSGCSLFIATKKKNNAHLVELSPESRFSFVSPSIWSI